MSNESVSAYPANDASEKLVLDAFKYYYTSGEIEEICFIDDALFLNMVIVYYNGSVYSCSMSISSGTELSSIMDIFDSLGLLESNEHNKWKKYAKKLLPIISQ